MMDTDGERNRIIAAIIAMLAVNLAGDLLVALSFTGSMSGLALATSASCICSSAVLLHFRKGASISHDLKKDAFKGLGGAARAGIFPMVLRSLSMIRCCLINVPFVALPGTGFLAAYTLMQGGIKAVPMCVSTATVRLLGARKYAEAWLAIET